MLYPLRRSLLLGGVLLAVLMACGAGLTAWLFWGSNAALIGPVGAAGFLWCVAAASALHFWFYQFTGSIRWDGKDWALESSESVAARMVLSVAPDPVLDLQSHLWLHVLTPERGRIWLWVERSARPERWLDLRRAVYSRARPGADNADETAPASSQGRES